MASDPNKATLNPEIKSAERSKGVAFQALQMAFGTMSSRVLGLLREMAFAGLFERQVTDAFIAAFRLPNLFRRLLGEGSLSVSFIPIFVEARLQDAGTDPRPRAKDLVDSFYGLLVLILSVLTVLGTLFPEPVLSIILDQTYIAQTEKFEMTVRMARIMFCFVFLISSYAFFMGILNALGKFALAAMAPTLFNVAMIASTFLPPEWFPSRGDGLAWGVVVGGLLQSLLLVPSLRRYGYFPRIKFNFGNRDVRRVLMNMVPGLIGLGLLQITTVVNMRFASELGEGPISWINWADRLLELPLSLVAVSLGTALLPTLAGFWARNEKKTMSDTLNFYLRLNFYVCLAAAVGLYFLSEPIIELLFQRGRFSAQDTLATAGVLKVWAMIMIPTSGVRVIAPGYYSVKNTWYPALTSAICLGVHLFLAPRMMGAWGLFGLNMSSFTSSMLNFTFLLVAYGFMVTSFSYGKLALQLAKFLVPAAAMACVLQLYWILRGWMGNGFPGLVVSLGVTIVLGALTYAIVSRLMKLEEFDQTAARMFRKISTRF